MKRRLNSGGDVTTLETAARMAPSSRKDPANAVMMAAFIARPSKLVNVRIRTRWYNDGHVRGFHTKAPEG